MFSMRPFLAALLGAAMLAAAGCGGDSSSAPTSSSDTASLAPGDAGALVVVDTDRASAQWKSVEALLARIPGGAKSLDDALSRVGGGKGLDFQKDVAPALGKQLALVVPAGARSPVLLAKPDDPKKLDALLARGGRPHVTGTIDGWTAVATTQQELDAYRGALAKGTLAGDGGYLKATAGLPPDALVRVYLNGSGLPAALAAATSATRSIPGVGTGGLTAIPAERGVDRLGTVGFAVSAISDAFRVDGSFAAKGGGALPSYSPTLLDRVPADALVAVSFDGAGQGQQAIDRVLKRGGTPLAGLQKQLGVKLDDLVAALDGEGVLYVRPGAPIPEITLAVKPRDETRAKRTFDTLIAKLGGPAAGGLPLPGFRLTTATVGGALLVSTAADAATTFAGGGPKLTAAARFARAAREVGLGPRTSGFAYVDVHGLAPLLRSALGALGGRGAGSQGANALDVLSAFDTAAAAVTVSGSRMRFTAVLRVG